MDHMLGHKTRLSKFKKAVIIPTKFSDHSGMKPEINSRRKLEISQMWKLMALLSHHWVGEEIKEYIVRQKLPKIQHTQSMGWSRSSSKRGNL